MGSQGVDLPSFVHSSDVQCDIETHHPIFGRTSMEPAGDMAFGFLGTLAIIFGIIGTVSLFFLPFFVYRIRKEVISMDRTLKRIASAFVQPDEGRNATGVRTSKRAW